MSKGLEALDKMYENIHKNSQYYNLGLANVHFKTIEKELKEYEEMKAIKGTTTFDKAIEDTLINACPNVAKKLKALEIIKNKMNEQNNSILYYPAYVDLKGDFHLVFHKEEWDFLKEVLL